MREGVGRRLVLAGGVAVAGVVLAGVMLVGRAQAQGNAGNPVAALAALLVDLPGCTAEKAETVSLSQGSLTYRWASRGYERGEARLTVMVGLTPAGSAPPVPGAESGQDMEMRAGPQLFRSSMVRGFRVVVGYNEEEKSGGVFVGFGAAGSDAGGLIAQFEGMSLDDAMALLGRFDWAAMKAQAAAK